MSNIFAVWSEGGRPSLKPTKLGYGVGDTFKEACLEWAERTLSMQWLDKDKLLYGGLALHKSKVSAENKRR